MTATPIPPTAPATAWWLAVVFTDEANGEEHWGYLDTAGRVSCCDGSDRRWFDSPEEAEGAAVGLRQEGWEQVQVRSNARW